MKKSRAADIAAVANSIPTRKTSSVRDRKIRSPARNGRSAAVRAPGASPRARSAVAATPIAVTMKMTPRPQAWTAKPVASEDATQPTEPHAERPPAGPLGAGGLDRAGVDDGKDPGNAQAEEQVRGEDRAEVGREPQDAQAGDGDGGRREQHRRRSAQPVGKRAPGRPGHRSTPQAQQRTDLRVVEPASK